MSSARRSLFNARVEQQPSRFYQHTNEEESVWQPGESLPRVVNEMEEFKSELHTMFTSMQASVTSELSKLKESMTHLEERITSVEAQITSLSSSSSTPQVSTPSGSSKVSTGKRKRKTPLEIQVCLGAIYMYALPCQ